MAERKSQQKWYPPDWDPRKGGVNKRLGTHHLGERAKNLHLGILVIRFEMPFNVWCEGCGAHIGKGVRYNAGKQKVGNYYSTPIYSFSMTCHLCSHKFLIETDPKNCDYKMVSGVRRKNESWEPEAANVIALPQLAEKQRMVVDAMYRLENSAQDVAKATAREPTLQRLIRHQDGLRHDYDLNALLRKDMRGRRKDAQAADRADRDFLERHSLTDTAVPLLPADKSDAQAAGSMAFASREGEVDALGTRKKQVASSSIFGKVVRAGSSQRTGAGRVSLGASAGPGDGRDVSKVKSGSIESGVHSSASGGGGGVPGQSVSEETRRRRAMMDKSRQLGFTSMALGAGGREETEKEMGGVGKWVRRVRRREEREGKEKGEEEEEEEEGDDEEEEGGEREEEEGEGEEEEVEGDGEEGEEKERARRERKRRTSGERSTVDMGADVDGRERDEDDEKRGEARKGVCGSSTSESKVTTPVVSGLGLVQGYASDSD